jgi:restriction system protein
MKFKMSERSLFATLLRAPWWVSFVVMAVVALVAGALLPEEYKIPGMLGAFPFFVIGVMAAWRQRHAISAERIEVLVEQARSMAWRDFAMLIERALRQQGFGVTALDAGPADFRIEKQGRAVLVSAKRWKAATVGAEHLRELLAARDRADAASCSCMTLGSFSPAALELAREQGIQLLGPADVAQLMHEGGQA